MLIQTLMYLLIGSHLLMLIQTDVLADWLALVDADSDADVLAD